MGGAVVMQPWLPGVLVGELVPSCQLMSPSRHTRCRFVAIDIGRGTGFPTHRHATHQLLRVDRGAVNVTTPAAWLRHAGATSVQV